MGASISFLSIILLATSQAVHSQCVPKPMSFPVANVTVNGGKIARGVALNVGNPPQRFSFTPRPYNNSYIYDPRAACPNSTDSFCATRHGGWYDLKSSSSYANATDKAAAGASDTDGWITSDWMTENFTITSNVSLPKFPIGVPPVNINDFNYEPQPALGLGLDSTLLNSLKNGGFVGARVWSFFNGLTGATSNTQMDGSLVFGGYDAGKVSGSGSNFTISRVGQCDYAVNIEDLLIDFPNGTSASLFSGSRSKLLSACIDPSYPVLMTMPRDNYVAFEQLTGMGCEYRSFGIDYWGMACQVNQPILFAGDLQIRIQQGPTIKVTNDQLLVPDVTFTTDGTMQANVSQKTLIINSLQEINANDSIWLGRQFLSAAYMMSNLDKNQFTLWSANPSGSSNLVAIDQNGAQVAAGQCSTNATASTNTTRPESTASANPSTSTLATAAPSSSAAAASSSNISAGTIAGIAVGSSAVAAIIAGALVLMLRKKRRPSHGQVVEIMPGANNRHSNMSYMYRDRKSRGGFGPSELPPREPSELPPPGPSELSTEPPRYSFGPQELDSGYDGQWVGRAR